MVSKFGEEGGAGGGMGAGRRPMFFVLSMVKD
ncbi:hypothetical protein A2U01_0105415, partial [Trifolium medium]|nr:hypothetical protein [Trifolium medium]